MVAFDKVIWWVVPTALLLGMTALVAVPIAMTTPVSRVKLVSVIAVGLIVTFVIYPQRVRFLIRRRDIWRP